MLDTWYPALRRSDYTVSYTVRPFTTEEAKEIIYTNPKLLSTQEMYLVAQTYETGSKEFNEVFEIAVRMFPEDRTANYNAACSAIERGDYEEAEKYLAKAGDTAHAANARGVMAMRQGDDEAALRYFEQARKGGLPEAQRNIDLLKDSE